MRNIKLKDQRFIHIDAKQFLFKLTRWISGKDSYPDLEVLGSILPENHFFVFTRFTNRFSKGSFAGSFGGRTKSPWRIQSFPAGFPSDFLYGNLMKDPVQVLHRSCIKIAIGNIQLLYFSCVVWSRLRKSGSFTNSPLVLISVFTRKRFLERPELVDSSSSRFSDVNAWAWLLEFPRLTQNRRKNQTNLLMLMNQIHWACSKPNGIKLNSAGHLVICFLTGMMNFGGTRLKLDCKNCVKILASKGKQLIYTGLNGRALSVLIWNIRFAIGWP